MISAFGLSRVCVYEELTAIQLYANTHTQTRIYIVIHTQWSYRASTETFLWSAECSIKPSSHAFDCFLACLACHDTHTHVKCIEFVHMNACVCVLASLIFSALSHF